MSFLFLAFTLFNFLTGQEMKNGFDLSNSLVDPDKIISGGPPKDGIPALTDPETKTADRADYLRPKDLVIGVSIDGSSRAYPIRIMLYHENANDRLGGKPIAVTY